MIEATDGLTSMLKLALDASVARHAVIANNIANANTPGFVPKVADFAPRLASAGLAIARAGGRPAAPAPLAVSLTADTRMPGAAGATRIDLDAADMAENAMHYEALMKILNKHLALERMAINEGKR